MTSPNYPALLEEAEKALMPFAKLANDIEFCMGPNGHPDNWAKVCKWPDLTQARSVLSRLAAARAEMETKP